jgi:hypothetical protein
MRISRNYEDEEQPAPEPEPEEQPAPEPEPEEQPDNGLILKNESYPLRLSLLLVLLEDYSFGLASEQVLILSSKGKSVLRCAVLRLF